METLLVNTFFNSNNYEYEPSKFEPGKTAFSNSIFPGDALKNNKMIGKRVKWTSEVKRYIPKKKLSQQKILRANDSNTNDYSKTSPKSQLTSQHIREEYLKAVKEDYNKKKSNQKSVDEKYNHIVNNEKITDNTPNKQKDQISAMKDTFQKQKNRIKTNEEGQNIVNTTKKENEYNIGENEKVSIANNNNINNNNNIDVKGKKSAFGSEIKVADENKEKKHSQKNKDSPRVSFMSESDFHPVKSSPFTDTKKNNNKNDVIVNFDTPKGEDRKTNSKNMDTELTTGSQNTKIKFLTAKPNKNHLLSHSNTNTNKDSSPYPYSKYAENSKQIESTNMLEFFFFFQYKLHLINYKL